LPITTSAAGSRNKEGDIHLAKVFIFRLEQAISRYEMIAVRRAGVLA
jgi:hypothetical protein